MKINYIAPKIVQTVFWLPVWVIFKLFARVKIYGKDNLDKLDRSNVIFASNHASEVDAILTTLSHTPFSRFSPMFYVARASEFYTGSGWKNNIYGGKLFALCGAYPAYSGKKDYEKSLVHHIEILSNGGNVHIFPEGTRLKEKEVTENARGGVAFLVKKTGVPIVPIAIKGVMNTSLKDFLFFRRKYFVQFGSPMYAKEIFGDNHDKENLSAEDYKNGARTVMRQIGRLYDKI